jgi:hypothetical protein
MSTVTAATIETYDEFKRLVRKFVDGSINFLLVEANPGIGKSWLAQAILDGDGLMLDNAALSAVGLFMALHQHKDRPIVLSDVDEILRSSEGRRILAALTETREEKVIDWAKQNRALDAAGCPNEFRTRSNVLLISNDIEGLRRRIPAILSRATYRRFEPGKQEVRAAAAQWFDDAEVFRLWSLALPFIESPDLRTLKKARELRSIGEDWQVEILKDADLDRLGCEILKHLTIGERPYGYRAAILRDLRAAGLRPPAKTFYRRIERIERATAWVTPMELKVAGIDKLTKLPEEAGASVCQIVAASA